MTELSTRRLQARTNKFLHRNLYKGLLRTIQTILLREEKPFLQDIEPCKGRRIQPYIDEALKFHPGPPLFLPVMDLSVLVLCLLINLLLSSLNHIHNQTSRIALALSDLTS
jgi:hypothetical protein